jgi:hypothetical protein
MTDIPEFTRAEAESMWARLVAGWAHSLDHSGARTFMDGVPNYADAGGSYEGVTRMMWGMGGWLSQPGRSPVIHWRGESFDLAALMRRALASGCDPHSPASWLRPPGIPAREYDQRTVESGQVGFATWQSRAQVWEYLSDAERDHVYGFLERFGRRPGAWHSNWALFWAVNHASRKALGMPFEQNIIDDVIDTYLDGVYCGDGWYDDAAARGVNYFDDYNTWVFASHVLAWAQLDGHTYPDRRDSLLRRVRAWMQHYPYFFAVNGAYSEFGRSLAYKFARLGAPLWAYKMGVWPHSAGMLKRLVGRHLRWYIDRGAVRADGTLRQPLTAGGSEEICERYISTGATYWAMQAFGGLWSLRDDDRFWSAPEEPLPAEQSDYVRVFAQPGWVVAASGGHIQRFNGGSIKPLYGPKYNKLVYSTRHPFNVGLTHGQPAPDHNLCLVCDTVYATRGPSLAFAVGEGWLRLRYTVSLHHEHLVDTAIVIRSGQHVRAHRITLHPDTPAQMVIGAVEGAGALGYDPGAQPTLYSDDHTALASLETHVSAIEMVSGYDSAGLWQGDPRINSVHAAYVLPVLRVSRLRQHHELICLVGETASANRVIKAGWNASGAFTLTWADGEQVEVPPLS